MLLYFQVVEFQMRQNSDYGDLERKIGGAYFKVHLEWP
jgi:hypothetical protein